MTKIAEWRMKNFRIDPLLDEKFSTTCGPVKQGVVLNELIKLFVENKIKMEIKDNKLVVTVSTGGTRLAQERQQ